MKLIDLLVQELPKRGGWPEGALNATQDKDGEVCFSAGAVPEFGFATWEGGDWCGNEFFTIRAADYSTAIITREQYEAALAASKAVVTHDGWIQWDGGECPVEDGVLVDIRIRNGKESHGVRANEITEGVNPDASHPFWRKDGNGGDIIAYRLHNTGINHRGNDDRLEQDLNECIGQDVDVINHPPHYTQGDIECIDAIKAATVGKTGIEAVAVANVVKYLWRYEEKGGLESVRKAQWYLNKLISELESK